jgi:uncharacterized protein YtpQ (UPF0354 family)
MSGSSILTGIFKCTNRRILDQEKKKTITYDTELLLGKDENDNDQFINAVLHFFVPKGENEPQEDIYHMVVAKVISIQDNTMVGEDHDVDNFDLELDAFMVSKQSLFKPTV